MLRIKLNSDGREKLAASKLTPQPIPLPKAGTKVSVAKVAEILGINPLIVRGFFISTQDHRRYPTNHRLDLLLKLQNHQIYFEEASLLVWFDMNYPGMKEVYYTRKERMRKARLAQ